MTTLTVPALLTLIATHHCVPPSLANVAVGIALHESRLVTDAVNHNPNGTYDYGLMQINSSNFSWLHLSSNTALDPCANIAAGLKVFFVKYNGNPPPLVAERYAAAAINAAWQVDAINPPSSAQPATNSGDPCQSDDPDGWHTVARSLACPDPEPTKENENDDAANK